MAQTFELACAAALHAIELEPELAEETYGTRLGTDVSRMGLARRRCILARARWNWAPATAAPSSPRQCSPTAWDAKKSVALARRAAALDPLSYIAHGNLALRCLNSDLLEEADAALDQAFKLNPRAGLLPSILGPLRLEQGRLEEALAAFQQAGIEALRLSGTAIAEDGLGLHADSEATLKQLIDRCASDGALQIAEAFAYRGDADRAFEWLERAYLQRDSGLP